MDINLYQYVNLHLLKVLYDIAHYYIMILDDHPIFLKYYILIDVIDQVKWYTIYRKTINEIDILVQTGNEKLSFFNQTTCVYESSES